MEKEFITIKEATSLSGKSEYVIRQWIQAQYAQQEAQQQAQQVIEDFVKKENQTANPLSPMRYLIKKEIVIKLFGIKTEKTESENKLNSQAQEAPQEAPQEARQEARQEAQEVVLKNKYVELLEKELEEKKNEIETKNNQISKLLETNYFQSRALAQLQAPRSRSEERGEPREAEASEVKEEPKEE